MYSLFAPDVFVNYTEFRLNLLNLVELSLKNSYIPATQLPTPALKDWSRSNAFIGQLRFLTDLLKVSRGGILKRGSNPKVEIGGSVRGDLQSRIRPRRRGSKNANSATESSSGPFKRRIN